MRDTIKATMKLSLCVTVLFFAGSAIGNGVTRSWYERELIKRGFAEYNATTGEWQWKGNSNADR